MSVFTDQKVYWIGPRESDIESVAHLFAGSITIFGSNCGTNVSASAKYTCRIDHNNPAQSKESDEFLFNKVVEYIEQEPSAKFMFYNANIVNSVLGFKDLQKKYDCFLCLNDSEILRQMNDKHCFHEWFKDKDRYNVLKIIDRNKNDCRYDELKQLLDAPDGSRFIVQAPVASGGSGTFVLSRENEEAIVGINSNRLEYGKQYLVSVYQENNISVNIHAVIYEDDIIFSPGSVQIMKEDDLRLMYRGGDFIAYRQIDKNKREEFERLAHEACCKFQLMGYRGVCGIDAIITKDEVMLLEVNDRFQASTNILNKGLYDCGFKSIHELNVDAFTKSKPDLCDKKIKDAIIDYSDYSYIYTFNCLHPDRVLDVAQKSKFVSSIDLDGYVQNMDHYSDCAYLFRVNFNTNIAWVNEEHTLNIHESIADPTYDWYKRIMLLNEEDGKYRKEVYNVLALKVALLTQGIVISDSAKLFLNENGGFRPATNNAMDLKITEVNLVVNVPILIKFVEFSPFKLDIEINKETEKKDLTLFYYNKRLFTVGYYKEDERQSKITRNGVPYSKVAYLSTDRLRVHITNNCKFKKKNEGCSFCNMKFDEEYQNICDEDLLEVIKDYRENKTVRHYLIGGQSVDDDSTDERLVSVAKIINEIDAQGRKYVMILPCSSKTIDRLIDCGVSEFAFNIEIYDEKIAKKYMKGKGKIPRAEYFDALTYAAARQKKIGDTRSLLIAGLEPFESLLQCIERLAQNNIQPIISIFRPLPETSLKDAISPSMEKLCKLYFDATAICNKFNPSLFLGPDCIFCQNNTLSLSVLGGKQ